MNSKHFFRGALAVFLGLALSSCQSRETDFVDQPETVDIEDPLFSGFSYVSITASYINASLDVRNYAAYNLRFHGIDPSVNYVRVFYPYDHQDPTPYSADDEISGSGYFGGFDDTQKIVYIIPTSMTN